MEAPKGWDAKFRLWGRRQHLGEEGTCPSHSLCVWAFNDKDVTRLTSGGGGGGGGGLGAIFFLGNIGRTRTDEDGDVVKECSASLTSARVPKKA